METPKNEGGLVPYVRAFFVGIDGQEHTISLAVDNGFIGDPGSFNIAGTGNIIC